MNPVFDPESLHAIARDAIGHPIDDTIRRVRSGLEARFPGQINPEPEWVFNNAGGAMGSMLILHASLHEYLIIFGSPIGTEGHTGRFWADDWFFILEGEQWAFEMGELERQVYRPGDMHHLPRRTAKGYRIPERCWALEYARGAIPAMLPFGVADTLFSTLDVTTLARTFRLYGQDVLRRMFHREGARGNAASHRD